MRIAIVIIIYFVRAWVIYYTREICIDIYIFFFDWILINFLHIFIFQISTLQTLQIILINPLIILFLIFNHIISFLATIHNLHPKLHSFNHNHPIQIPLIP